MPVLQIKTFGGIAPVVPPRYLQDNQAQIATNCPLWNGSLQPLTEVGDSVTTLTKTGTPKTIYRYGIDVRSDDRFWFHWTSDVDVCRSQIAGDGGEWTFFTGDGGPKATYSAIALSGDTYPQATRPLGIPSPNGPVAASPNTFTSDQHPAKITLTSYHLRNLTTNYGIRLSTTTDDADAYVNVSLSSTTASDVAQAINSVAGITATEESGTVVIETTQQGENAKLYVKFQTGTRFDRDGQFSYSGAVDETATGTANTEAMLILTDAEINSISTGDIIELLADDQEMLPSDLAYNGMTPVNASRFLQFLQNYINGVTVTRYGSSVVITPDGAGGGAGGTLTYRRTVGDEQVTEMISTGSDSEGPARIILTQQDVDNVEGSFLSLRLGEDDEDIIGVSDPAYVNQLAYLSPYGVTVEIHGAEEPFAIISSNGVGTETEMRIRSGNYPNVATYALQQAEGYEDEDSVLETRVYTYTHVNKETSWEFESAPASASGTVDVRDGQTVTISGFATPPDGYIVTHRRIYRAVNGVYLFVAEIPVGEATFTDDVEPDGLGEELPTLTWAAPPQNLQGLINLPNGMMAGFVGRDIYFCDPYHPHAWPLEYVQTVDFQIVGLGRMDTTLVVLTTGTPYFIQGTHPDNMAIVKSEFEQACVSKKSIVPIMGGVVYAAPDGLMLLSSAGSKIVTEQLFSFAQWQAYFKPESIHAYQQDNQYIAFYKKWRRRRRVYL